MNEYSVNILIEIRDGIELDGYDDQLPMVLNKLIKEGYIERTDNGHKLTWMGRMFLKYGPSL
jgi:ribosomal protein S19E (S16A)